MTLYVTTPRQIKVIRNTFCFTQYKKNGKQNGLKQDSKTKTNKILCREAEEGSISWYLPRFAD